jgi:hypothetical protein
MKHTALALGRVLLAVVLYPVVAVLSFWRFGDDGVTAEAVAVAAVLNLLFAFGFGWLAPLLAAVFFPIWYLAANNACENCSVILDAGAFSFAFAVVGALVHQGVAVASRDSRVPD